MKRALLLSAVIFYSVFGCSHTQSTQARSPENRIEKSPFLTMEPSNNGDIVEIDVKPAWHNGKDFSITQNLHPNNVAPKPNQSK